MRERRTLSGAHNITTMRDDVDERSPLIPIPQPNADSAPAVRYGSSLGGVIGGGAAMTMRALVVLVLVAAFSLAVVGMSSLLSTTEDLQQGGGTLLMLPDTEGLGKQLRILECYVRLGKTLGMTVAVGPFRSPGHYGQKKLRYNKMVEEGNGWRQMTHPEEVEAERLGAEGRCILGKNPVQRNAQFNLPSGVTVAIDPRTAKTSFDDLVAAVRKASNGGAGTACVGTLQLEPECTSEDILLEFNPVQRVADLVRSAREGLFGSSTAPFRVVHLRRGDKCTATSLSNDPVSARCDDVRTLPFLPMCGGGEADMPTYVATDDFSSQTQAVLRRRGCKVFGDIPGSGQLQDWEGVALDMFLMSEATDSLTMGCSALGIIANTRRRRQGRSVTRVYDKLGSAWVNMTPTSPSDEPMCRGHRARQLMR